MNNASKSGLDQNSERLLVQMLKLSGLLNQRMIIIFGIGAVHVMTPSGSMRCASFNLKKGYSVSCSCNASIQC